jgi:phosphate transport system substrate-binding protein
LNLKKSRMAWLLAVLAVFALFTAACSDDDSDSEEGSDTSTAGGDADVEGASGAVFVTGSSTVEPISTSVAEALADENPDIEVTVEGPGTGDGFEAFCAGDADVTDASRPIKAEEVEACESAGVEFIELKVGIDGISVLTNPANTDVTCLNFADLYALIGPEAEGFTSWSDAQPLATELGSATELPDLDLDITAPGEESGTYDSFIELAFADIAEAQLEAGAITEDQAETTRPDYSSQADDNAIIAGIEGSDGSLGWVGFAFAEQAGDGVTEVEVAPEAGTDCVAPSAETIQDGSYPLSRDLYIYVNAANAEDNPAVAAYVDFYVSDLVTDVEGVGYVALDDESQATTQQTWADRTTGTVDGGE